MRRDLAALAAGEHDVVIVGGGIHGACAAWDAAQRGLRTALLEAEDFGAGTSWNSLKTIHGGLRYLQTLDFGRMRESVRERSTLLRIAPQLVQPLPFVVPTHGHGAKGREALGLALWISDRVGHDRNHGLRDDRRIPASRLLSRRDLLDLVPGLDERGLSGGALWHDAQVQSSERLTLAFLHAASAAGALLANHCEVVGVLRAGARVAGARARDGRTGGELEVRARLVLIAAGPGMDRVLALAGVKRPPVPLLRAMNLVLRRPVVGSHAVGAASEGRFLFLVPWQGRSIVGTAYVPAERPADPGEAASFLDAAARAYPWAGLEAADVGLVHRGLVPGRGGAAGLWGRHLLLDHEAEDGVPGLISVLGVKYTTARGVAEQAIDLAFRRLGQASPPCRTATTPLARAAPLSGSPEERVRHVVREEMALTLADAVLRRLDLGTAGPPDPAELDAVARVMAAELGWDAGRIAAERRELAAVYGELNTVGSARMVAS